MLPAKEAEDELGSLDALDDDSGNVRGFDIVDADNQPMTIEMALETIRTTVDSPPENIEKITLYMMRCDEVREAVFNWLNTEAGDQPENARVVVQWVRRMGGTLINMMFDNLDALLDRLVHMSEVKAWTLLMVVMANASTFVSMYMEAAPGLGIAIDGAWNPTQRPFENDYVLLNGLCVSELPIGSYTVQNVLDSIELLRLYWCRLPPSEELSYYLEMLIVHSCWLVGHIETGKPVLLDVPKYRSKISGHEAYISNTEMLRFLAGPLNRMRAIVEFVLRVRTARARTSVRGGSAEMARMVKNVRAAIAEGAKTILDTMQVRSDIFDMVGIINVQFGEVERFAEEADTEPPSSRSLASACKGPEVQQALTYATRAIDMELVATTIREEEDDFLETAPVLFLHYNVMIKMIVASTMLRQYSVSLVDDFVLWEPQLPLRTATLGDETAPIFVHIKGMVHVHYASVLYHCRCVEEALAMWCWLVLEKLRGRIGDSDLTDGIRRFLFGERLGVLRNTDNGPAIMGDLATILRDVSIK